MQPGGWIPSLPSLPFSSINLTRPATELSLPATCPSLRPPPYQPSHSPILPPLFHSWKMLHFHTVMEHTRWRKGKTRRVDGKRYTRMMTEHSYVFYKLDTTDTGKKWVKVTDRRSHEKWPVHDITLDTVACCGWMSANCGFQLVKCAVAGCCLLRLLTEKQTTQTEW